MNKEKLISMSYDFISCIFQDSRIEDKIKRIFLFGSVARNDFDENSDIDIFIDVDEKNEELVKKIAQRALARFYRIEGEKYRLKGIKNIISLKVGNLAEWELKTSIEKEGIALFSLTPSSNFKKNLLFYIEPIKSSKKRVKVIRKLFGRHEKNYKTSGLVQEYGGKVLSPRVFIMPASKMKETSSILAKEKVNFGFEEIWK